MRLALLAGLALVAGCQSGDANRVLAVARSPSVRSVTQIASAGDRDAALRALLKQRQATYERDPRAALADLQSLKRDYVILPYEETRQYLVRVVGLRRQFLSYGN
jgi:hypothetical protein